MHRCVVLVLKELNGHLGVSQSGWSLKRAVQGIRPITPLRDLLS